MLFSLKSVICWAARNTSRRAIQPQAGNTYLYYKLVIGIRDVFNLITLCRWSWHNTQFRGNSSNLDELLIITIY